jgi:predicted AlkP superfamily pyrophosphatase or phosphodiesterase
MISLDGTRPTDGLGAGLLPSLEAVAARGAVAQRMLPPFPSNTFPGHVTLVTGVAPERHGIVNNTFWDSERGLFKKRDIPSWIEVEPLWSLLAAEGIPSASFHWVGSEGPWRSGRGPRYWHPFEKGVPELKKVRAILAWLDLADARERPRFITAWFRGADGPGHEHGPGSEPVRRSLASQESALASLVRGIEERGLWPSTTLFVVSDHGMARAGKRVDLDAALEREGVRAWVVGMGGFAQVYLQGRGERGAQDEGSQRAAAARVVEIAQGLGLEARFRPEAEPELRVAHPRFGDVVVWAPPGVAMVPRRTRGDAGFHGYRPEDPGMGALFVAAGRGIAPGRRLGPVRAIDVAPTLLALFGVTPPDWMEGRVIEGLGSLGAGRAPRPASATLSIPGVEVREPREAGAREAR